MLIMWLMVSSILEPYLESSCIDVYENEVDFRTVFGVFFRSNLLEVLT